MKNAPKMSAIFKELAMLVLRSPEKNLSSEAAHAALLLTHVAWNRSLGHDTEVLAYGQMLGVFTSHNPGFWSELRSRDAEALIATLRKAKEQRYPEERRVVLVCGMRQGNVHIEWCYENDYPQALEAIQKKMGV